MAMEKVQVLHPLGGTVTRLKHVETVEPKKLSKNQRKKLLKGYYSKEKHVEMLTNIMHGKYYQSRANNKKGVLPSQWNTVFKSVIKMPVDIQAHIIREQEKRTQAI
jgi:hypothetical protein